jgi:hypothetical protein
MHLHATKEKQAADLSVLLLLLLLAPGHQFRP